MGGSRPAPAYAPAPAPAPAAAVKKAEPASEALRRRRLAEGRTGIVSTDSDEDNIKATKKLLGT